MQNPITAIIHRKHSPLNRVKKLMSGLKKEQEVSKELHQDSLATLGRFKDRDPQLGPTLEHAAGFAVYPSVGRASLVLGGSYGKGEVFERGKLKGYSAVIQFTLGVQVGGETFSELLIFEDEEALKRFKSGPVRFASNASAVIVKAGGMASSTGTRAVVRTEGGMLLEVDIGLQKFVYRPAGLTRGKSARRELKARRGAKRARRSEETEGDSEEDEGERRRAGEEAEARGEEERGEEERGEEERGEEERGEEDVGEEDVGEEDLGEEDAGEEDVGEEDVGEEDVGEEDAGEEDAGEEDAGEEDLGEEDLGEEDLGEEDLGEEDLGEEDVGEEDLGEEDLGEEDLDEESEHDRQEDEGAPAHATRPGRKGGRRPHERRRPSGRRSEQTRPRRSVQGKMGRKSVPRVRASKVARSAGRNSKGSVRMTAKGGARPSRARESARKR